MRGRRTRMKRTAKSCGPDAAVLASVAWGSRFLGDDEVKRAVLRGEHETSRNAIAQGMPECSGCSCMLVCALFAHNCTRDRGCSKHRHSLRPLLQRTEGFQSKTRADSVARSRSHIPLSSPAKAGDPVFQRASDIEPRSRGVLDPPLSRGMTPRWAKRSHPTNRRHLRQRRTWHPRRPAMIEPNCNYDLRQHLDAAERGDASAA